MVSSFSIFFIVAFYFYFKQRYTTLIDAKIEDADEKELWHKKLKRKLMVFPAGVFAVVVLYAISFTLMNIYPDADVDVKSVRRVIDGITAIMFIGIFFIEKGEIDKRLSIKKPTIPPVDKNEPGIDIPEMDM